MARIYWSPDLIATDIKANDGSIEQLSRSQSGVYVPVGYTPAEDAEFVQLEFEDGIASSLLEWLNGHKDPGFDRRPEAGFGTFGGGST